MNRATAPKPRCAPAALAGLGLLLAGCEGTFTADLVTEPPADPAIVAIRGTLLGLEFEKSGDATARLEFRDGEPVDLLDYAEGTPLRVFTDETLPSGEYTGVRLLFEQDAGLTMVASAGGETPGQIATGTFADVAFRVEDDERSREAMTLVLDLRRSLVLDESADEYTLTPALRAVPVDEAAHVTGVAGFDCPAGSTAADGRAVYVFEGRDVEPDDLDSSGVEPYATTRVTVDPGTLRPVYALRFLSPGNYTVAPTCLGGDDEPGRNDALEFGDTTDISLDARESLRLDLG